MTADAAPGPAAWSAYVAFYHADPVLGNVELRRALAHAVDRDALDATVPDNLVVARGGIVPPALQGHTPDIVPPYDPDEARACLERSGAGKIRLVVGGYETWVDAFLESVTATWSDVLGIECEIRPWTIEQAYSVPKLTDLASVYITGWLPGYADPEYYLRLLFHSDSRTNEGGFSHPPFDDLIERAPGAEQPEAPATVPRGGPDGGGRADRGDPARLRAKHGVREAVGSRLVGVRQVLRGLRRPHDRPGLPARLIPPRGTSLDRGAVRRSGLSRGARRRRSCPSRPARP